MSNDDDAVTRALELRMVAIREADELITSATREGGEELASAILDLADAIREGRAVLFH